MDGGFDRIEEVRNERLAPPRPFLDTRRSRRAYAALDLGTNNCRLLIARPGRDGFQVIDAFSRVVRLGEKVAETGALCEGAKERALDALHACAAKIRRHDIAVMRSVATEACRRAANGPAFIEQVYRETGIALDVITAEEEARLAVLGCQVLIDPHGGDAIVFDIGGGSTELVLVRPGPHGFDSLSWTSLPLGVVSLAETEPEMPDPALRLQAYARMRERVAAELWPFRELVARQRNGGFQLLGTSGTITTLAALHLGLRSYDRRQVDGCFVSAASMRELSAMLARMSRAERAMLPNIGVERADLVVAGCAILEALLDAWPVERIRVADRGIREGILRMLLTHDLRLA